MGAFPVAGAQMRVGAFPPDRELQSQAQSAWVAPNVEILRGSSSFVDSPKVDGRDAVDRIHAKALELGGQDEGAPGPCGQNGGYFGYFLDLDGNKHAAFTMGAEYPEDREFR